MPSSSDIEKAFHAGDGDSDDGLSVRETSAALKELCGKSFDSDEIESACSSCGISTSSELTLDQFKDLVRHMDDKGNL